MELAILLFFFQLVVGFSPSCIYTSSTNYNIDLNPFVNTGSSSGDFKSHAYYGGSVDVYFNPCAPTNSYNMGVCAGQWLCINDYFNNKLHPLGDPSTARWSENHGNTVLSMSGSDYDWCPKTWSSDPNQRRSASITIICDSSSTPSFVWVGGDCPSYYFELRVNCANHFVPPTCIYKSSDGIQYNLKTLSNQGPFGGDFRSRVERFDYYYNPCSLNTNYYLADTSSRKRCAGNVMCQSDTSYVVNYPLGLPSTTVWNENGGNVSVKYFGDSPGVCTAFGRSSIIHFECDYTSTSPSFTLFSANYEQCRYEFKFQLNCATYFGAIPRLTSKVLIPSLPSFSFPKVSLPTTRSSANFKVIPLLLIGLILMF